MDQFGGEIAGFTKATAEIFYSRNLLSYVLRPSRKVFTLQAGAKGGLSSLRTIGSRYDKVGFGVIFRRMEPPSTRVRLAFESGYSSNNCLRGPRGFG
jgi:hypothetical protein